MSRRIVIALILVALFVAAPVPAAARLVAGVDLPKLTAASAAIVVARVLAVTPDDSTSGLSSSRMPVTARLEILRVLKGDPVEGTINFRYVQDTGADGTEGLWPGTIRLIFAVHGDDGIEGFVDPDHASFAALPSAPSPAAEPLERAVAELAQLLLSPRANDRSGEGHEAVEALGSTATLSSTAALLTCAKDGRNPNHFDALGALLERNNLDALSFAEPLFLGLVPPAGNLEYAASDLEGIDDVRAIPTLARLLGSSSVRVRRGAAYALRAVESWAAMPALTKALYDSDREVRYHALMGLGELADEERSYPMMPSVRLFERDETKYLRYWRAWAKSHKPPPIPAPRDTCEVVGRSAQPDNDGGDDVEVERGIADDGTEPRGPVVTLDELGAAPGKYLGRVTLRNVVVDGLATRVIDGAPLYVLCVHDAATNAGAGPGSALVLETGKTSHNRRLREIRAGEVVSLEVEVRRLAEGYNARIVQFVR